MAEKPHPAQSNESADLSGAPRRVSGHHADMRDTVAELAERAQVISQEAGTKVSAAMKDVIGAAAGIAGFAIESARDLVQYMVRRGQMTPEEGERLIRDAEAAHDKRSPGDKGRASASKFAADRAAAARAEVARAAPQASSYPRPVPRPPVGGPTKPAAQTHAVHKVTAPPPAKTIAPKAAGSVKSKPAKAVKAAKPSKPSKPAKKKK
jgi:polyhydroxyalkanoate synthesis regulator phasin